MVCVLNLKLRTYTATRVVGTRIITGRGATRRLQGFPWGMLPCRLRQESPDGVVLSLSGVQWVLDGDKFFRPGRNE